MGGSHKGKFVGLWIDEEALRRLDEAAEAAGISRSEMVRRLVLAGLAGVKREEAHHLHQEEERD